MTQRMRVFLPELAKMEIERMGNEILAYKEGKVDEEAFKKFRLENGVYGIRFQKDIHMVRVKVPGGLLDSTQLEKLGEIAKSLPTGLGHVTTRQDVQFHWVKLESVTELLTQLAEVGLNTREACGNTVRNVTLCPLAGVSEDELFDVTPYAKLVADYFVRNPLCQNLPRKFKIAFEGCATEDHAATAIHDIGALAEIKVIDGRLIKGFKLYVGGGLSTMPTEARLLEEFTPADKLLITFEAILRVFDRFGNRDNPARARMKFLIQKIGLQNFRQQVLKERMIAWSTRSGDRLWDLQEDSASEDVDGEAETLEQVGQEASILGARAMDQSFDTWMKTNAHPQRQPGYYYAYVTLPAGDITSNQFFALADIARRFSRGRLRTTRTQNLILRWVREGAMYRLYKELESIGLGAPGVHRLVNVIGCPGADTCNLAITHSHRLALQLFKEFSKRPDLTLAEDLKDVTINVSGCPNSCGQHHVAPIGFYGSANRIDGKQAPYYTMLLGGEVSQGKVIFGQVVAKVPAKKVPEAVIRIIDTYRAQRNEGETFMQWTRRLQKEEENDSESKPLDEPVMIAGRSPS